MPMPNGTVTLEKLVRNGMRNMIRVQTPISSYLNQIKHLGCAGQTLEAPTSQITGTGANALMCQIPQHILRGIVQFMPKQISADFIHITLILLLLSQKWICGSKIFENVFLAICASFSDGFGPGRQAFAHKVHQWTLGTADCSLAVLAWTSFVRYLPIISWTSPQNTEFSGSLREEIWVALLLLPPEFSEEILKNHAETVIGKV